jgi:drug/metabolite transporter (DMT)-like permease
MIFVTSEGPSLSIQSLKSLFGVPMKQRFYPFVQALLAAILFGASAPLAKILLGEMDAIPMAGFLYLGSGVGALVFWRTEHLYRKGRSVEARLTRAEVPWLIGAIVSGGVIAPVVLLLGLKATPASTASLLLNFESVATTLIAVLAFKEAVDKRIWWAVGLITLASILLSWNTSSWGISLGALGILAACFLWGLDNNFTRNISAKNPLVIVAVKGLGAGTFNLIFSLLLGKALPAVVPALLAMVLGVFSYGLSIYLFILAMRSLGSARTSALFGSAPFVGTLLSVILLREMPQGLFWLSMPIMIAGAWLMLSENHEHHHIHEPVEHIHAHAHPDEHHNHCHPDEITLANGVHCHLHLHNELEHSHHHTPDLHHRHIHEAVGEE